MFSILMSLTFTLIACKSDKATATTTQDAEQQTMNIPPSATSSPIDEKDESSISKSEKGSNGTDTEVDMASDNSASATAVDQKDKSITKASTEIKEKTPPNKETTTVEKQEPSTPVSNAPASTPSGPSSNTDTKSEQVTTATKPKTETSKPTAPAKPDEQSSTDKTAAQTETGSSIPDKPEKIVKISVPNHKAFDALLSKYVSASGVVDYKGLKSSEAALDGYLKTLESLKPSNSWGREEQLAFWINAYNAYTVKLILDNYPVKSITDLHGGKPWDHKWIKLNGKTLSLNNIENDIIRPDFNEPRIHFGVNCAAKSCPPLLNKAFTAGNLDSQLESQTKKFINNSAHNTLGKKNITVSKIFDWYGKDFGNVAAFVSRYADNVQADAKVSFNEYDWALNGK